MRRIFVIALFSILLVGCIDRPYYYEYEEKPLIEGDTKIITHYIRQGGKRIFCELSYPKNYNKKYYIPVVIMCHGTEVTHTIFDDYISYFTAAGYACCTFDFCGSSSSSLSSGGGQYPNDLNSQTEDAQLVYNWIVSQTTLRVSDILMMGEDQGGLISLMASTYLMPNISGQILLYPGLKLISNSEEFLDYYPDEYLFIHGEYDDVVSVKESVNNVKRLGDRAELIIVEKGKHGFTPLEIRKLMPDVIDWCNRIVE